MYPEVFIKVRVRVLVHKNNMGMGRVKYLKCTWGWVVREVHYTYHRIFCYLLYIYFCK